MEPLFCISFQLKEQKKKELSKININESMGILRNRINKRQVKEYLCNLNIYKSAELCKIHWNTFHELAKATPPVLVFVIETYVAKKFKWADLVLEIKQPKADPGKGGLVSVSKLPVKTVNEIINQSMSTLRKIT